MAKKLRLILILIVACLTVSIISSTYSRYVADTTGNINMSLAKWQLLVNNNDILSSSTSTINITPVIDENEFVAANKLAPTSTGYFDIEIDPTATDVSFNYSIDLNLTGADMPDLLISRYAIINETTDLDNINYQTMTGNRIQNTMEYTEDGFETFTIRVCFEWYDGSDNEMDDDADAEFANTHDTITVPALLHFEQKLSKTLANADSDGEDA